MAGTGFSQINMMSLDNLEVNMKILFDFYRETNDRSLLSFRTYFKEFLSRHLLVR